MRSTQDWAVFGMFVISMLLTVFGVLLCWQRDDLREQAIKRGYAEWVVEADRERVFKWKESGK